MPSRMNDGGILTRCLIGIVTCLIAIAGSTGCDGSKKPGAKNGATPGNEQVKLKSIDDLKNKRIGVLLGSVHDTYATKRFPQATVLQYKSPSELVLAVRSGKIDAAMYTHETLLEILRADGDLKLLASNLFTVPIATGFNKDNDALRETFNVFLQKIKGDGTYAGMVDRWITGGKTEMPGIANPKKNGTLVVGIVSDKGLPFTIVRDNRMIGFDVELTERFAAYLGKELKLVDMEFGSLIAAVSTNKIDMITSTLMITEERRKQIDYSDEYMRLGASIFARQENIADADANKLKTLDDIADKSVGVYAGTIHDAFVEKHYPHADIKRFNSPADIILSLKTGKTEVAFLDLVSAKVMLKSNPDIGILSEDALTVPLGVGFNKNNPELRREFNRYLNGIRADGTYDTIYERWFVADPETAEMPKIEFAKNGAPLTLAVAVGDLPNSAIVNGEHVGFDVELIKTFAERNGYRLKITTMEFASLVAALASGKADMIADGMAITAERQKRVDFSDSYNVSKTAVLALNVNLDAAGNGKNGKGTEKNPPATMKTSFLRNIAASFHSNMIQEKRYLLILDGLRTTMIISVLATLFGTLLGGLICLMRMSRRRMLVLPAQAYIAVLRGTPALVVLMIIFYVVFASVDIDPILVAVIAFGLNFAAYVSEIYRTGIEGVNKGQTEAGIAIGFSRTKTFIHIVLPQAAARILPVYKGEMVSLVKMTSIVGYIAVQDLTKASDIIRSRTFDAFFPLIMVAVLYLIISWLLLLLLGYVERKASPRFKAHRASGIV
jgi:polar amino acid transport system substrate-binding protein